jgi:hypothetical protein
VLIVPPPSRRTESPADIAPEIGGDVAERGAASGQKFDRGEAIGSCRRVGGEIAGGDAAESRHADDARIHRADRRAAADRIESDTVEHGEIDRCIGVGFHRRQHRRVGHVEAAARSDAADVQGAAGKQDYIPRCVDRIDADVAERNHADVETGAHRPDIDAGQRLDADAIEFFEAAEGQAGGGERAGGDAAAIRRKGERMSRRAGPDRHAAAALDIDIARVGGQRADVHGSVREDVNERESPARARRDAGGVHRARRVDDHAAVGRDIAKGRAARAQVHHACCGGERATGDGAVGSHEDRTGGDRIVDLDVVHDWDNRNVGRRKLPGGGNVAEVEKPACLHRSQSHRSGDHIILSSPGEDDHCATRVDLIHIDAAA